MTIIDHIFHLFAVAGQGAYFGEAVTETEHALQTAHLAEQAGADDELIAAALLHDVGHLLHGLPENVAEQGIDGRHEEGGADWLRQAFRPGGLRPRPPARRGQTLPVYGRSRLRRRPVACLAAAACSLQGGPYTADEVQRFEREPFAIAAVALRRWDDGAKVPGLVIPGLEHYRACLESALSRRGVG